MADKLDYALLSGRVYYRTPVNRTRLEGSGWTELKWLANDSITGFSAGVYQKDNEIVIAFAGTDETLWKDFVVGNIPAGLGLGSAQIGRRESGI